MEAWNPAHKHSNITARSILLVSALALLGLLAWEIGWPLSDSQLWIARFATSAIVSLHILWLAFRVFSQIRSRSINRRSFSDAFLLTALAILLYHEWHISPEISHAELFLRRSLTAILAITQTLSLSDLITQLLSLKSTRSRKILPPGLMFVLTLVGIILIGSVCLMSPNATYHGISWIDAFFVSTSAVCVTGLCPVDFPATFTFTGQAIVLGLIQIGAWGVISFAYFIAIMMGEGISLRDRLVLSDLLASDKIGQSSSFLRNIILTTLTIELAGAACLYLAWSDTPDLGMPLWWCSLFHSISAFCNAGFSLFGPNLAAPQAAWNIPAQAVIMFLIVAGGIGFAMYQEIYKQVGNNLARRKDPSIKRRRWSTYSWLVVRTTLVLLLAGTLILFAIDLFSPSTHPDASLPERLWLAAFNSVTARTAGFNIRDMSLISAPYALMLCALMFIGGSPGGTAGGVRTTTIAIAYGEIMRIIRGKQDVELHRRAVDRVVVERSLIAIVLSGAWVGALTLAICLCEPNFDAMSLFFETVSAFGTVGLSLNITPGLGDTAKLLLILSMTIGRVGLLAFVLALAGRARPSGISYPRTRIPLN